MTLRFLPAAILPLLLLCACAEDAPPDEMLTGEAGWEAMLDTTQRVAVTGGFSGPEAVRYDPEQDVYFVSNFNGPGGERDNNGFISRMGPDGSIEELRFIAGGTNGVTLHAPRGMALTGDTLWVADADGVLGFHRRTGAHLATADFSGRDTGFLNDVVPGPDGTLYVTDTGRDRIYRIDGDEITVALEDTLLGRPNGITWDAAGERFIVVPFGGRHNLYAWEPGSTTLEEIGTGPGAGFDGVEVLPGERMLVASQADSSIHLFTPEGGRPFIPTAGRPADIGIDTERGRVAVPFVARDEVSIWQLPQGEI